MSSIRVTTMDAAGQDSYSFICCDRERCLYVIPSREWATK
jgi:hypothetical protein